MIYIAIISAKVVEVALQTIRIKFVANGNKLYASFISFFQILLWLYIVGTVLTGIQEDIFKSISYAFGYSAGLYLGMIVEEKLGVGYKKLEVTVKEIHGKELAERLRKENIAATMMSADGRDHNRNILFLYTRRKDEKKIVDLIKNTQPNSVIVSKDVNPQYGGVGLKPRFN